MKRMILNIGKIYRRIFRFFILKPLSRISVTLKGENKIHGFGLTSLLGLKIKEV